MKISNSAIALGIAFTAFTANDAWAEKCNGYVISKALAQSRCAKHPTDQR